MRKVRTLINGRPVSPNESVQVLQPAIPASKRCLGQRKPVSAHVRFMQLSNAVEPKNQQQKPAVNCRKGVLIEYSRRFRQRPPQYNFAIRRGILGSAILTITDR